MGPRAPPARVVCAAGGAAGAAPSSPPSSGPAALRAWAADPVAWAVAADAGSWDVAPFKARWKHGGDVQPMASGVAADALFYSALKHGLIHISAGINRVNAKIDALEAKYDEARPSSKLLGRPPHCTQLFLSPQADAH